MVKETKLYDSLGTLRATMPMPMPLLGQLGRQLSGVQYSCTDLVYRNKAYSNTG
jgi:hypothetical protein